MEITLDFIKNSMKQTYEHCVKDDNPLKEIRKVRRATLNDENYNSSSKEIKDYVARALTVLERKFSRKKLELK